MDFNRHSCFLEDRVKFKKLGLVIIDEQHRFGVEQGLNSGEETEI